MHLKYLRFYAGLVFLNRPLSMCIGILTSLCYDNLKMTIILSLLLGYRTGELIH